MNPDLPYSELHRNILLKLKKKIFRKPNFDEAAESLGNLARVLKDEECPEYAAIYLLEKARCERSVGNFDAEAASLCEAAELFFQHHQQLHSLNCLYTSDYKDWGSLCLEKASKIYDGLGNLDQQVTVLTYLADRLRAFACYHEALVHYRHVMRLVENDPSRRMHLLKDISYCLVKSRDFVNAIQSIILAKNLLPRDSFEKLREEFAIKQALLALVIDPFQQQIVLSDQAVQATAPSSVDHTSFVNKKLAFILESLTLACHRGLPDEVAGNCDRLLGALPYEDAELVRELKRSYFDYKYGLN